MFSVTPVPDVDPAEGSDRIGRQPVVEEFPDPSRIVTIDFDLVGPVAMPQKPDDVPGPIPGGAVGQWPVGEGNQGEPVTGADSIGNEDAVGDIRAAATEMEDRPALLRRAGNGRQHAG